jgi:hypothetical protein
VGAQRTLGVASGAGCSRGLRNLSTPILKFRIASEFQSVRRCHRPHSRGRLVGEWRAYMDGPKPCQPPIATKLSQVCCFEMSGEPKVRRGRSLYQSGGDLSSGCLIPGFQGAFWGHPGDISPGRTSRRGKAAGSARRAASASATQESDGGSSGKPRQPGKIRSVKAKFCRNRSTRLKLFR